MIEEEKYKSLLNDLEQGNYFFKNGELGKSRVIARQVAGKAIRELFSYLQIRTNPTVNPYQYLQLAKENPAIFKPILSDLDALTRKVNTDYSFPEDIDLIQSSKNIITFVKEYNYRNGQ
jgi:hypothetical protein